MNRQVPDDRQIHCDKTQFSLSLEQFSSPAIRQSNLGDLANVGDLPIGARPGGACLVDFHIDFEFRSALMQRLIGVLFNEAVRRTITAVDARDRAVYGPRE